MTGRARLAGLLLALVPALDAAAGELVADRVSVRAFSAPAGTGVVVRTSATVAGNMAVDGEGVFADGIAWLAPAPGLPMGAFTNTGCASAQPVPEWWRQASVLDEGAAAEDFAAATRGQVQGLVRKAANRFVLAGLATPADWMSVQAAPSAADDGMPVSLGELKAFAGTFWSRLVASGATNAAPWSPASAADDALVNVGQVKQAFAFSIPESADSVSGETGVDLDGDSDGDGLTDLEETGGVAEREDPPWLAFDAASDLTASFDGDGLVHWTLPEPLCLAEACVTDVVVDVRGVLYFPRPDAEGARWTPRRPVAFDQVLAPEALLLAPFWDDLSLESAGASPSRVRAGAATHEGARYLLFEFGDMRCGETAAAISFQVAVPVPQADRAHVRYRGLVGTQVDGRTASVGFQTPDGRVVGSYCHRQARRIREGLALEMNFGRGTDPFLADTDGDGLLDGAEVVCGTDPLSYDMDGDGMPDGWEVAFGFDPGDASDGALDADGDGLTNVDEYLNGASPTATDTDGDGTGDGVEVQRGSDPADGSDRGQVVPEDRLRTLTFDIGGDWTAWELKIEGLGPDDFKTRRIPMTATGIATRQEVKLRKGNSYRLSEKWLNCDGHEDGAGAPWFSWELRVDSLPSRQTYVIDGCVAWRNGDERTVYGSGWVAENDQGLLSTSTWASRENGGNVAEGLSATLHVLGDPVLAFDYDRDGRISDEEVDRAKQGKEPFRFWINDDRDEGDVCAAEDYMSDCPSLVTADMNAADARVNGRRDLVDFMPVWIDLRDVFPPRMPQRLRAGLAWKLWGSGNAVWTSCGRESAGSFRTRDLGGCGVGLDEPAHAASVSRLGVWDMVPAAFCQLLAGPNGGGLFLFEGKFEDDGGLYVAGCSPTGKQLVQGWADLRLSKVEKMYRWLNLRDVCVENDRGESRLGEPVNRPDGSCDGLNFVFVHGFNVNAEEARANGAEVFKRLWQSGLKSMFTVVDWRGDDSQYTSLLTDLVFDGPICPDYYANVVHAFESAGPFASRCAALPGAKVVLAHSLGNMLVSSAAVDHGLAYERYYMLNAAVAMEAYHPAAFAGPMVDRAWRKVPKNYRATGWHGLFPPEDFRRGLSWKGRFKGLRNAVNCYSSTEEVLGNARSLQLTLMGSVWKVQEMTKGTRYWDELNTLTGGRTGILCEGGWGVNARYALNPYYYAAGYNSSVQDLAVTDIIREPLFTPFRTESANMHDVALFRVPGAGASARLRARLLAAAIPAESFATGANRLSREAGIANMQLDGLANASGTWPSARTSWRLREWRHSDMKNIAYFFVHPLYDRMVRGE